MLDNKKLKKGQRLVWSQARHRECYYRGLAISSVPGNGANPVVALIEKSVEGANDASTLYVESYARIREDYTLWVPTPSAGEEWSRRGDGYTVTVKEVTDDHVIYTYTFYDDQLLRVRTRADFIDKYES